MISEAERCPLVILLSCGILCVQVAAALGWAEVRHSLMNKGVTDLRRPHGRMCDIRPIPLYHCACRDRAMREIVRRWHPALPPPIRKPCVAARGLPNTGLRNGGYARATPGPSADPLMARPTPAPFTRECGRRVSGAEPSARSHQMDERAAAGVWRVPLARSRPRPARVVVSPCGSGRKASSRIPMGASVGASLRPAPAQSLGHPDGRERRDRITNGRTRHEHTHHRNPPHPSRLRRGR